MKQTRFVSIEDCGLQVCEPQEGQTESRMIEGTPIVFGVRSVNLTPWSETREVYEVLEPGCITNELLKRSDVILNLNHSNMVPDVLGRCRNGQGTLSLELRGDSIGCRCDLPRTNNANDTLELMRRGDITGMSFAFEDDWQDAENGVSYERTAETRNGKEVWLRRVKKITGLYDVAIVTHPAYEQTSVGTREASDGIDAAIEEQLKRECGGGDGPKEDEGGGRTAACGEEKPRENECGEEKPRENECGETEEEKAAREEEERAEQERERMIAMQRRRSMRRHLNERMIESLSY